MWEHLPELATALGVSPADLAGFIVAGARVLPAVILVPALGLGIASAAVRVTFGVVLAASILPAVVPAPITGSLTGAVLASLATGLPVAIVASVALWAAWMAGALVDGALFAGDDAPAGSRFGLLLGLLASIAFLQAGGASEIAERLARAPAGLEPLKLAADAVARGIGVAVLMAAPVLMVVVLVQVTLVFVMRADPRGSVQPALELVRPVLVLFGVALLLERVAELVLVLGP